MSKTHRAQIPAHVHTNTLTDVSIHLDCHTHTPPRDRTSSVSRLNYSSPSSCLSLFSFPSVSLTSVWEMGRNKDTCLACCRPLAPDPTRTQNQCLKKSARTCIPDVLPNVLMRLNVPSKTTTLRRNGLWGVAWVNVLVWPRKTNNESLMALLAHTKTVQLVQLMNAQLLTIRPEHTWLSAKQISGNISNNWLSMPNIADALNCVLREGTY